MKGISMGELAILQKKGYNFFEVMSKIADPTQLDMEAMLEIARLRRDDADSLSFAETLVVVMDILEKTTEENNKYEELKKQQQNFTL